MQIEGMVTEQAAVMEVCDVVKRLVFGGIFIIVGFGSFEILFDLHPWRGVQVLKITGSEGRIASFFTERSSIQTVGADTGLRKETSCTIPIFSAQPCLDVASPCVFR